MRLTEKDKTFLELLRDLMGSGDLSVDLQIGRPSYMILRGTYGEKIHRTFRMSRQGVRWRFQRLFNQVYVEAFQTILMIEKTFGTQLREHAIRISRERFEARQAMMREGLRVAARAPRRQASSMSPSREVIARQSRNH